MSHRSISLVFVVSLALSGSARAGVFNPDVFENSSVCGETTIANSMAETDIFTPSDKCESHCKKAKSECAKLVRSVFTCYKNWYAAEFGFAHRNCNELSPASRATCNQSVKSSADDIKGLISISRDEQLASCNLWSAQCIAECNAP